MSVRQSLLFAFAQKYSILILRLISLVVVSRLVAPEAFGVFFAALGIATLGRVIGDFGLQQFLVAGGGSIRANERRALGAGLLTNGFAAAGMLAAALLLPSHILDPRVALSVEVLLLPFLLGAHAGVAQGMLQRQMRFAELYRIAVWAVASGIAVTVVLAFAGLGYLAPVLGAVAEQTVAAVLSIAAYRPRPPSLRGAMRAFRFGGVVATIDGLKKAGDAVVPLAVGAVAGYASAGLLGRAQNVILLFDRMLLDAIGFVLLPALAQQRREGRDIAESEGRITLYLAAICWPFFAMMFLLAPEIVAVLLGPQWHEAAHLVRILAIGGLLLPFHALQVQYFIAMGHAGRYLPWATAIQTAKSLLIVVASFHSLEAAAAVLVAEPLAKAIVARTVMRRGLPPPDAGFTLDLVRSAAAASAALAAAAAVLGMLADGYPSIVRIVLAAVAAVPAWAIALYVLRHPLRDELGIAHAAATGVIGAMRSRLRPASPS